MRTLLLIAVLATFASVTASAEAQWLRSRRSSECANGQCGLNSVAPAADQETAESQPAADAVPSSPAAPEAAPAPAAEASPAAEAPAAPATSQTRSASTSSSRTRSANDAGTGRFWRRMRSRL